MNGKKFIAFCFITATVFAHVWGQEDEIRRKRRTNNSRPRPVAPAPAPVPAPDVVPPGGSSHNGVQIITGKILDEYNSPLPGAMVRLKDALHGTVTNDDGVFRMEINAQEKVILLSDFLGYETSEIALTLPQKAPLSIVLNEKAIVTKEVVVITASRRTESRFDSPVTVYKLDALDVRENPTLSVYQGAGYLPGVQVINSSFLLSSINIRGFGQSMNSRILYLNDGVDLQSPIIGTPIGSMNGASDLDVSAAETIAGPASALYGPNAFNGVFSVLSKDPFQYPGLSVMMRSGAFHFGEKNVSTSPFLDGGFRYAKVFNDKFAIKMNAAFLVGDDWRGGDLRDGADYAAGSRYTTRGPQNPGYDGVNTYGDELGYTLDSTNTKTPVGSLVKTPIRVTRTGYSENQLTDYQTRIFRGDLSAHYHITKRHDLVVGLRYSRAEGMLQRHATRYWLDGGTHVIARAELKHKNYFVRAYILREYLPQWYSVSGVGANTQALAKSDPNWFAQFALAYNPDSPVAHQLLNALLHQVGRDTIPAGDPNAARAFADADNRALYPYMYQVLRASGLDSVNAAKNAVLWTQGLQRPQAGTALFDSLFNRTTHELYQNDTYGSRTALQTGMHHIEGQYSFNDLWPNFSLYVGGSARLYMGASNNRFYYEGTKGVIYTQETGLYAQGVWHLLDSRLQLTGSIRFDKNLNFNLQYSPRLAASLALGKERNHIIRAAFNSGFRPPTLEQQSLRIETPIGIVTGGIDEVLRLYNLTDGHAFAYSDYQRYAQARLSGISREDAASLLKPLTLKSIQPEIARSLEAGYRFHWGDKFMFDAYGYATYNLNLMAVSTVIGPVPRTTVGAFGSEQVEAKQFTPYTIYQNSANAVLTYGAAAQASFNLSPKLSLTGNYGYNAVRSTPEVRSLVSVNFSNPEHVGRVILTGRNLAKKFGFLCAVNFASGFQTLLGSSRLVLLPTNGYTTLDLQVNYKIAPWQTIVKIGGTNLLNNRHTEILAGGSIGTMVYLQLNFDQLLH